VRPRLVRIGPDQRDALRRKQLSRGAQQVEQRVLQLVPFSDRPIGDPGKTGKKPVALDREYGDADGAEGEDQGRDHEAIDGEASNIVGDDRRQRDQAPGDEDRGTGEQRRARRAPQAGVDDQKYEKAQRGGRWAARADEEDSGEQRIRGQLGARERRTDAHGTRCVGQQGDGEGEVRREGGPDEQLRARARRRIDGNGGENDPHQHDPRAEHEAVDVGP
jgi:hypothetical protein